MTKKKGVGAAIAYHMFLGVLPRMLLAIFTTHYFVSGATSDAPRYLFFVVAVVLWFWALKPIRGVVET